MFTSRTTFLITAVAFVSCYVVLLFVDCLLRTSVLFAVSSVLIFFISFKFNCSFVPSLFSSSCSIVVALFSSSCSIVVALFFLCCIVFNSTSYCFNQTPINIECSLLSSSPSFHGTPSSSSHFSCPFPSFTALPNTLNQSNQCSPQQC